MFYAIVPAADRRELPRRPSGLLVTLSRIIGGEIHEQLDAALTDVSSSGIGLRCPVPLERNALYRVQSDDDDAFYVRVNRSRRRFDGAYDVGARHA
jgi:hypothetical protein